MPFTIPNIETPPVYDAQSVTDDTDFGCLVAAISGTGVVSGCLVSQFGAGTTMQVSVASGVVLVANQGYTVTGAALSITAASAQDRRDIVVYTVGTGLQVIAGTPCPVAGWVRGLTQLPPVKPAIPANSVLLAEVYVASSTTAITSTNIVDKTTAVGISVGLPQGIYNLDDYGGDPTGTNDSTAALNSLLALMPNDGGLPLGKVRLSVGDYKFGSVTDINNLGPILRLEGAGTGLTRCHYYGSNQCFRAFNSSNNAKFLPSGNPAYGGGITGVFIDLTNATGTAACIHGGDTEGYEVDAAGGVIAGNSPAANTFKGIFLDNANTWCEKGFYKFVNYFCNKGFHLLQNNASGGISFQGNTLDLRGYTPDGGDALLVDGGGKLYHANVRITGASLSGSGGGSLIHLAGVNTNGNYSSIQGSDIEITVECRNGTTANRTLLMDTAPSGTNPQKNIGHSGTTGGHGIVDCRFFADMARGSGAFLSAQSGGVATTSASFWVSGGPIIGDSVLAGLVQQATPFAYGQYQTTS